MSVVLGHEAYRDGVVGANNKQETRDAVLAHTKMAARMKADGVRFGGIVGQDLAIYDYALSVGNMGIMDEYADAFYNSEKDYFMNIQGDIEHIDAFKKFIYQKTGYTISVSAKGGVSIENIGNRDNIGNQIVADTLLDIVKDDNYTVTYNIVNENKDVFFDAYGEDGETARFDIGDYLSANKKSEGFATVALQHTLVEQRVLEKNPLNYEDKKSRAAFDYAHKIAIQSEGPVLFGKSLYTRKDSSATLGGNKTGYIMMYKIDQTETEAETVIFFYFDLDENKTPY
jgi:hypothetical protein